MRWTAQIFGILKKNIWIENQFRIGSLNKIFIGPVLNAIPAFFIFHGLFVQNKELTLGEVNSSNLLLRLLIAVSVHAALNAGYYSVSSKIMKEWWDGTFPLARLAPCSPLQILLGILLLDLLITYVLALCSIFVVALSGFGSFFFEFKFLLFICPLFMLGVAFGLIRSAFLLSRFMSIEVFDYFYRGFLFFACLYIPKELFPRFLWPFCELNPIYHAGVILNGALGLEPVPAMNCMAFAAGFAVISFMSIWIWTAVFPGLIERARV